MSRDLGQQVIVENKGGGQGSIATVEAARARPDGYTLILGHVGTLAVNPTMMPNLSYDPRRDFAPIILLAKLPMVFAVGAKVPAATLPEFVALARAKPGVLNYGSAGNGSAGHLAFEMLKTAAAIDVMHVPYKGTGAQVTDPVSYTHLSIFAWPGAGKLILDSLNALDPVSYTHLDPQARSIQAFVLEVDDAVEARFALVSACLPTALVVQRHADAA